MRIISGKFRGRKLLPIRGMTIRPTSDRLRESLFSILSDRVRDAVVLDIFAGTGALGIEALSRGARYAVFIDKYAGALSAIARNIGACSLEKQSRVIRWDVSKNLGCIRAHQPPFDLVFMDPPYDRNLIVPALTRLGGVDALAPGALVVVEHSQTEPVPEDLPGFSLADQRKYGKTLVSFLNYDMNAVSKTEG